MSILCPMDMDMHMLLFWVLRKRAVIFFEETRWLWLEK